MLGSCESALKGSCGGGCSTGFAQDACFETPKPLVESAECWGMAAALVKSEVLYQERSAESGQRPIATGPDREATAASTQAFAFLYLYIRRIMTASSRVFPDHA
ncbi:hypothetical protein [Dyadobacter sp. LHD-138]|uniref:hypothetical protein n=1 Tax=Dyadobacter sp. LHD-138 TaxID=3071413 RepID=UPI0027E15388|nr:hypothetical protein [Dyadobacter sp. LHD-138]MDQ6482443.1 hypothetical protein [Dyadobacter sp. LHD-138]